MVSRRETIKTLAASLAVLLSGHEDSRAETPASSSEVQQTGATPRPPGVALVFQQSLAIPGERDVTAVTVEYAPGAESAQHRHSGPVLGYVLEGSMIMQFGDGAPVTYSAGQMFYEPEGGTHRISRNASSVNRAKILAIIFGKKGEPLTVPVK